MSNGIDITACYRIVCDGCGVRAEPDTEYRTMAEALAARERVATEDGWLLHWIDTFPVLTCPECVAAEDVGPPE
jgi:hypothetical protein